MRIIVAFDSVSRNPRLYEIHITRIQNRAFEHKLLVRVVRRGWLTEKKGDRQERYKFYLMVEISNAENPNTSEFVANLKKYGYDVFVEAVG